MAKKENSGISNFVPINRRFFDHPFWKEERTFSKSEAWIDLIRSARFDDTTATELIGGKMVSWTRGQLPASLRFLADRWKWSNNKVDNYLRMLEQETMIERLQVSGQTVISLINFEEYNTPGQQKGQQKGHQEPHLARVSTELKDSKKDSKKEMQGTVEGQTRDKTNTDKKVKTEEDSKCGGVPPAYTQADQEKFKALQAWISTNAANVARMKEPLTIAQYAQLKAKFTSKQIAEMLERMHNWKPLLQKNINTYKTFLNWSGKAFNQNSNGEDGTDKAAEKMENLLNRS